jgi:hypothetical protein
LVTRAMLRTVGQRSARRVYPCGSQCVVLTGDTFRFGFREPAFGGMMAQHLTAVDGILVNNLPFVIGVCLYHPTNKHYGNSVAFRPLFTTRVHGELSSSALAELHNGSSDGIAISFNNVSSSPISTKCARRMDRSTATIDGSANEYVWQ